LEVNKKLSTIYSFIPVNGYVGINPSLLFCPRAYNAVKAALTGPLTFLACLNIKNMSYTTSIVYHGPLMLVVPPDNCPELRR
jgi:hypothetical protein